jgi:hypothetical protein
LWHFFALPVLVINVIAVAIRLVRVPTLANTWSVVVAIALVVAIFMSRVMPLRAQDRVIRLEERLRLEKILPADLRGRVDELTPEQLIGLRFASDDELPQLIRRALSGELRTRSDIKAAIATWRPDLLRV